jgi:hypothetical protein
MHLYPLDVGFDYVDRHAPGTVWELCVVRVRVGEHLHLQFTRDSAVE